MATRNRYVKLQLAEACPTNLMGSTVVGQYGEVLLVERPQPKPRAATRERKPRATKPTAAAFAAPAKDATLAPKEA
jgi:hypothetical protein